MSTKLNSGWVNFSMTPYQTPWKVKDSSSCYAWLYSPKYPKKRASLNNKQLKNK
jgi:hypothetical protein